MASRGYKVEKTRRKCESCGGQVDTRSQRSKFYCDLPWCQVAAVPPRPRAKGLMSERQARYFDRLKRLKRIHGEIPPGS